MISRCSCTSYRSRFSGNTYRKSIPQVHGIVLCLASLTLAFLKCCVVHCAAHQDNVHTHQQDNGCKHVVHYSLSLSCLSIKRPRRRWPLCSFNLAHIPGWM